MAMNFDNVDVNDFGHVFNDGIEEAKLAEATRQLEAARDRAESDVRMRQVVLSQAGHAYFGSDDTWQRLSAKADRWEQLRYAVVQKYHMVRAMAEAQRQDGPRLYQVDQAECQQKKSAYEQAVADVTMAKKNALDFGPDLPDVREHVDYLAKQAAILGAEYQLATKKLAYNEKRQGVVQAYDSLIAAARKLCMAPTDGERRCLGLLLNLERKDFDPLAMAYNAAAKDVNGAIKHLATVRGPTSCPTATTGTIAVHSTSPLSSAMAAAPSTAAVLSTSASATTHVHGNNNQLEAMPRLRDGGLPTADIRQSTSAARRDFEALLATIYGGGLPSTASGSQVQATIVQATSATRLTTTTNTTTQRLGRWIVTETSVVQASPRADPGRQAHPADHVLGASVRRGPGRVPADVAGRMHRQRRPRRHRREHRPPRMSHPAGGDGHPHAAAPALPRLPHRDLGEAGHSDRRGQREDCAWINFRTLDEAIDCKWRWDGMGHWGLTVWDDWNNQPRPLHFSFSTHPAYKGKKE